jgi:hypothetical protein
MSLEDLGNIGEFVAAVAVVISLVYLAVQIRQNTNAVRVSMGQENVRAFADFTAMFCQPGVSRIYRVGLESPENLDADESIVFNSLLSTFFANISQWYAQKSHPAFDPQTLAFDPAAGFILRLPGGRRWWKKFRGSFPESFQTHIDSIIEDADAHERAGVDGP